MRIIIVEDEPRSLKGMRNLITSISEEYEITAEAGDGKRALELIQSLKPDVVFTDIRMPVIDGIQLVELAQKYQLQTRFVIVSAYAEFEYAKKAITLGVKEYLIKPLTYDEMEQVLERLASDLKKGEDGMEDITLAKSVQERYPQAHCSILRAVSMVEDGYAARLSQEEIAENLGMTQEYFSYLFHKEIGMRFSDFVRDYRIEVSKKLLLSPNIKIQDVAYAVGYSDAKYFSKIFRKVTGETPGGYLKRCIL